MANQDGCTSALAFRGPPFPPPSTDCNWIIWKKKNRCALMDIVLSMDQESKGHSPIMEFVSVVISRHNIKQQDVFGLCIQSRDPKLHLRKHLSVEKEKGNINLTLWHLQGGNYNSTMAEEIVTISPRVGIVSYCFSSPEEIGSQCSTPTFPLSMRCYPVFSCGPPPSQLHIVWKIHVAPCIARTSKQCVQFRLPVQLLTLVVSVTNKSCPLRASENKLFS